MQGNVGAILVLEATGPEAGRLGAASRKEFGADGGTIGRAADNAWVLSHPAVSGHHASIQYSGGAFYIVDTSTNGIFLNSRSSRLAKGQAYAINSGDLIIIEPFRIQVSVVEERPVEQPRAMPIPAPVIPPSAPAPIGDPFRSDDPFAAWSEPAAARGPGSMPAPAPGPLPSPAPDSDEVDPLKLLFGDSQPRPASNAPRLEDLQAVSPVQDHFAPPRAYQPSAPAPAQPQMLIPEDYDPAAEGRGEPAQPPPPRRATPPPYSPPAPPPYSPPPQYREPPPPPPEPAPVRPQAEPFARPARPAAAPGADAGVLAEVLAGAGLPDAPVTSQLATQLGAILRVVVSGVMDVLRARQQIKDEFRMQATRFMQRDNNSLKFSANVNDALHNLLVKQNPAFLGPVESFEDAFRDLRNHQIAMLAGMRVAFESMLAEFEPDQLQAQFDRVVKKSVLGTKPEAQYWEMYRQRAQDLARDIETTFRNLFGDRFVSAYQEQFERLTAQTRKR